MPLEPLDFDRVNRAIVGCNRCPRLRAWCQTVSRQKRSSYADDDYWGLPVPNFGDPRATRLIVGLAPAAHGANRTGRMFTGDRSGDWLFRALHRAGAANMPTSTNRADGLELQDVMITAVAHCAPPGNKPSRDELAHCRAHLDATLRLRAWNAILCLGGIAWSETTRALGLAPMPRFAHGVAVKAPSGPDLVASYHPSQQNTFTGRLTESMLDAAISRFLSATR